jgi:oligo-1,6-glucosidase
MTNYPFHQIEEYNDVEARNGWKDKVLTRQVTADEYLRNLSKMSRDNARTPMQGQHVPSGLHELFETLAAGKSNYKQINAAQQQTDPKSVYNFYRRLLALRRKTPALVYGDYKDLDPEDRNVFAYTRILGSDKYFVLINLSSKPTVYHVPDGMKLDDQMINGLGRSGDSLKDAHLDAWESRIYSFR